MPTETSGPALELPSPSGPLEVLTLVASAGGEAAIETILKDLPADFPLPIVVMQHLAPDVSIDEPGGYGRKLPFAVQGVRHGSAIARGKVLVCPSRVFAELLPDGTFVLTPCEDPRKNPLDRLLESVARSFGDRAIAAVLTGMQSDGAEGALELRAAGGYVLVQSETSAEYPSMPRAAIQAGVANLVVPLRDVAQVIREVVGGTRRPKLRSEIEAVELLFAGPGRARAALRVVDWAATSLGPVLAWSAGVRSAVRTVLSTTFPATLFLGPDLVCLHNDPAMDLIGGKVTAGLPAAVAFPEAVDQVRPVLKGVMATGEPVETRDLVLPLDRAGIRQETHWFLSRSAVYDDVGTTVGVMSLATETTAEVIGQRRMELLARLANSATGAQTPRAVCERAGALLRDAERDVPFALFYLLDPGRRRASLCAAVGLEPGSAHAQRTIDLGVTGVWNLDAALSDPGLVVVDDLARRLSGVHCGPWPEAPTSAVMLPLRPTVAEPPLGVVILGVSARLPLDDAYRSWLKLVANQMSGHIADALAREHVRERLERLTELDRTKTEFFANISHEFRTPLTLMLAPLEDSLADPAAPLTAPHRERLELVRRNGLRLQKLVNTLLDFSRIEAGRVQASFVATDLAALTRDLASSFRSAVERAGLEYQLECPELPEPIYVDASMWEKIVLNLLSNAFKFTLEGRIRVSLRWVDQGIELSVEDTGTGIPNDELPRVFERFHRVEGARGRSYEGTGIGLALVQELVKLHGGRIAVESALGRGTTFRVFVPSGSAHLPKDRTGAESLTLAPTGIGVDAFLAEVSQWSEAIPEASPPPATGMPAPPSAAKADARVLIADDNADMRSYVARLLSPHYSHVETVPDGVRALEAARAQPPDLILSDIMMPGMDGIALVEALRADQRTQTVPVILLSARAGEEATIQGLESGADEYLMKPFSAKELLARVRAQLAISRLRRDALRAEREHADEALRLLAEAQRAVSEERSTARALRESERRMQLAMSATSMVTWEWTPSIDRITTSDSFAELYGLPALSAAEQGFALVLPEDRAAHVAKVQRIAAQGGSYRSEFRIRRPSDSRVVWLEERAEAQTSEAGDVARIVGVTLDITERKAAEEALRASLAEREALLKELHHRVKNNLQVITSLLEMQTRQVQAQQVKDMPAVSLLNEARNRVNAIGTIHELLYQSGSLSQVDVLAYARRLVPHVVSLYDKTATTCVSILGDQVMLDLTRAIPLGLLLNELVSNACKHAFPTNTTGRLEVAVHQQDGRMRLRVTDTGIGIPAGFMSRESKTLGLQLVHMLAKQLGGTVEFHGHGGTTVDVHMPR